MILTHTPEARGFSFLVEAIHLPALEDRFSLLMGPCRQSVPATSTVFSLCETSTDH